MKISIFLTVFLFVFSHAGDLTHWLRPDAIPFPQNNPGTPEKVALGKLLFFDKRLSKSNTISCATCHNPKLGWSDNLPKAIGDAGKKGRRNSPTIINSAYLNSFFHDGRANSLEEQALGPIETEVEMNMPIDTLVIKLQQIKGYPELFTKAFGDKGISKETIVQAIASFERTVLTQETPFDRWIKGDKDAISRYAKIGFEIFQTEGRCHSCHNGFNFTNESLNNVGLGDTKDLGAYEVSKNKSKLWYAAFKTPTLREIEKTAPYFHDGSVATLEEAVSLCGNGGRKPVTSRSPFFRDRKFTQEDVEFVVHFLKTLTADRSDFTPPTIFPGMP